MAVLARWRVSIGFAAALAALTLARPTWRDLWIGLAVAAVGELIRVWAAGHIEKGREITRSGPYRYVRHPLYVGSTLIGIGFAWAARSGAVWILTAVYLIVTLSAAVRTEEATLDARFLGDYAAYREGRAAPMRRSFSLARAVANREYRALLGVAVAFLWLAWRAR